MLDYIEHHGYRAVLGSVYPHDPQIRIPALNAWHINRGIHPGAIIIIHDRPYTPETLRSLLPQLKQQGYELVTVSQLLEQTSSSSSSSSL
jgi:peptidoglycan-N-acetylglucosamine deacetylase